MLKHRLCEATIEWQLTCEDPLLIRDERYEKPSIAGGGGYPSCIFLSHLSEAEIKQQTNSWANKPPYLTYYVPGTSLRGPFRAQAERIIRTLRNGDDRPPATACDPFEQESATLLLSCSKRLEGKEGKYAKACPACRLFGCAGQASRITFIDAQIETGYRSVYRDMVGIDRFTGGQSSGALMRFHVLENTVFGTQVSLVNFELWQLGLLAYVFRDFADGLVPIGFGKTKGFGLVKGTVAGITLRYAKRPENRLEHLGSLCRGEVWQSYNFHEYEAPAFSDWDEDPEELSLYHRYKISGEEPLKSFWQAAAPAFNDFVTQIGGPMEAPPEVQP